MVCKLTACFGHQTIVPPTTIVCSRGQVPSLERAVSEAQKVGYSRLRGTAGAGGCSEELILILRHACLSTQIGLRRRTKEEGEKERRIEEFGGENDECN